MLLVTFSSNAIASSDLIIKNVKIINPVGTLEPKKGYGVKKRSSVTSVDNSLDVTDEEMAKSTFARSHTVRKLRK